MPDLGAPTTTCSSRSSPCRSGRAFATSPPGAPKRKTTIEDLQGSIDEWLRIGEDAVTKSVRRMDLPQSGEGLFVEVIDGVTIRGYVRGGEIDTFFPEF